MFAELLFVKTNQPSMCPNSKDYNISVCINMDGHQEGGGIGDCPNQKNPSRFFKGWIIMVLHVVVVVNN